MKNEITPAELTAEEIQNELKEVPVHALRSFETMDGQKFRLAICSRKGFGSIINEWVYVREDKQAYTNGTYTGGTTGAGTDRIKLFSDDPEYRAYRFIAWA
jgi:hypothetical protein